MNQIQGNNLQVLSKSALKNKKRKEAAKAAKLAEAAIPVQKRAGDQAEALAAAANHAKEIKEQTYQVENTPFRYDCVN